MASMKEILNELTRVAGIDAAVVVGRDGFVIDGQVSGVGMDMEAVGAVVSTGVGSAEAMGGQLRVGDMTQAMLEYKNGVIVMGPLGGNAVLAVVAASDANLGNVRYQVKQRAPAIERSL